MGAAALKARIVAAGLAAAVPLVMVSEGLYRKVYIDPVGIPTACWGHTGAGVVPGRQFTRAECEGLLYEDLLAANRAIDTCVTVPLAPHERSAYGSFVFNVGGGAFCRSTLVRRLNRGDRAGACAELSRWVYASGIKLPGLVIRRERERAMCEGREVGTP